MPSSSPPVRTSPLRTQSPDKERLSPTKENLEVARGAFYFSCELPMSKVGLGKGVGSRTGTLGKNVDQEVRLGGATPKDKKTAGTKMSTPTMTPKKTGRASGTPSPLKKHVMEGENTAPMFKKVPARMQGTDSLSRKTGVHVGTGSGAKNVVPNKSVATSTTLRNVTTHKKTMRTQIATNKSSTATPVLCDSQEEKENVAGAVEDTTSPGASATPPRPKRGPSFDMGDMMAGLNISTPLPPVVGAQRGVESMPTPLKRAATKIHCTTPITGLKDAQTMRSMDSGNTKPNQMLKTQQSLPVLAHTPLYESAPNARSKPERKVTFQHSEQTSSKLPMPVARRVGTDPGIHAAMRQEMAKLTEYLSRTIVTKGSLGMNRDNEGQTGVRDFFYEAKGLGEGQSTSNVPGGLAACLRAPKGSSPTKPSQVSKAATPQKKIPATPGPTYTPTRQHPLPTKAKPAGTIPQTARTSIFDSPIRNHAKTTSSPSTPNPTQPTPQLLRARKPTIQPVPYPPPLYTQHPAPQHSPPHPIPSPQPPAQTHNHNTTTNQNSTPQGRKQTNPPPHAKLHPASPAATSTAPPPDTWPRAHSLPRK